MAYFSEAFAANGCRQFNSYNVGMRAVNKPDKLLLDNPNLFQVLCSGSNHGSIRESFFVSQLGLKHQVHYHDRGDFVVGFGACKVFCINHAFKLALNLNNQASNSRKTSGCLIAMSSNFFAAPEGFRLPCSHACNVLIEIPSISANCD